MEEGKNGRMEDEEWKRGRMEEGKRGRGEDYLLASLLLASLLPPIIGGRMEEGKMTTCATEQ